MTSVRITNVNVREASVSGRADCGAVLERTCEPACGKVDESETVIRDDGLDESGGIEAAGIRGFGTERFDVGSGSFHRRKEKK